MDKEPVRVKKAVEAKDIMTAAIPSFIFPIIKGRTSRVVFGRNKTGFSKRRFFFNGDLFINRIFKVYNVLTKQDFQNVEGRHFF